MNWKRRWVPIRESFFLWAWILHTLKGIDKILQIRSLVDVIDLDIS
ncbi:MAG: hypothetical protein JEZ11_21400 [Desulfobacterales bacterium]|nr:hypothetical protein [Desulfobacterales bacterium]